MNQVDEFKEFVKTKPDLLTLVSSGKYNWQQLYELYTLYGKEHEIWRQISKKESSKSMIDLLEFVKSIDVEALISGMQGLEKLLDLFAGYLESNFINSYDD